MHIPRPFPRPSQASLNIQGTKGEPSNTIALQSSIISPASLISYPTCILASTRPTTILGNYTDPTTEVASSISVALLFPCTRRNRCQTTSSTRPTQATHTPPVHIISISFPQKQERRRLFVASALLLAVEQGCHATVLAPWRRWEPDSAGDSILGGRPAPQGFAAAFSSSASTSGCRRRSPCQESPSTRSPTRSPSSDARPARISRAQKTGC